MEAPDPEAEPLVGEEIPAPDEPAFEGRLVERVGAAATWALGAMAVISALRLASHVALSYLLAREFFGVIAVLRAFLMALQQFSEVGIRDSVVYHKRGGDYDFLCSAWSVQVLRGGIVWLAACGIAWPVSTFYSANDERAAILLFLLPVCGLEALVNGAVSVRLYAQERRLRVKLPLALELTALVVALTTTLVWALISPSVWALAIGPLAGGVVRLVLSHLLFRERPLRLRFEPGAVRDLFHFGKWVFAGTVTAFLSQQFHVLYLARAAPLALVGVYQVAWNFVAQATKPLSVLNNRVLLPVFAEFGRRGKDVHTSSVGRGLERFLPACLCVCASAGLGAPALFGYLFEKSFVDGGDIGRWLSIVVWFMILQHAPRSALLSIGHSRGVFLLTLANAVVTVGGCSLGYVLGSQTGLPLGGVKGLLIGNGLGNLVGCAVGVIVVRYHGLRIAAPMVRYSLAFLVFLFAGTFAGELLSQTFDALSPRASSLLVTVAALVPLAWLVWNRSLRTYFAERRAARAPAPLS